MGHGTNNSHVGVLLQGQHVVVVLEEHDTLSIKVTSDLLVLLGVDVVPDLVVRDTSEGLLEETHGELGAEHAGNSLVEDRLVELARLDKVGDGLVAPVATAHLDIVTSGEGLQLIRIC